MKPSDPKIDERELRRLLPSGCHDVKLLDRGKRGVVFKAVLQDENVAIKVANPASQAREKIAQEARNLETVNAFDIGPRLIDTSDDYVVMEYIDGFRIGTVLAETTYAPSTIRTVLHSVLYQLYELDRNGINKQEMTNPYKHIIIRPDNTPILIDFERARSTLRPANITQFSQYLTSKNISSTLQKKGLLPDPKRFLQLANTYHKEKGSQKENVFKRMLEMI